MGTVGLSGPCCKQLVYRTIDVKINVLCRAIAMSVMQSDHLGFCLCVSQCTLMRILQSVLLLRETRFQSFFVSSRKSSEPLEYTWIIIRLCGSIHSVIIRVTVLTIKLILLFFITSTLTVVPRFIFPTSTERFIWSFRRSSWTPLKG